MIMSIKSRRVLYLVLLLLLTGLFFLSDSFESYITRITFLFTSQSREILIGYLQEDGIPKAMRFIGLMVVQSIILPFRHEQLIFAGVRVFGEGITILLTILGRTAGTWLAYDLGRVFPGYLLARQWTGLKGSRMLDLLRNSTPGTLLLRILPLPFDTMSYLGGTLKFHEGKILLISALWITGTTTALAVNGGYYSYSLEGSFLFLRFVLSLVLICILLKGKRNET